MKTILGLSFKFVHI